MLGDYGIGCENKPVGQRIAVDEEFAAQIGLDAEFLLEGSEQRGPVGFHLVIDQVIAGGAVRGAVVGDIDNRLDGRVDTAAVVRVGGGGTQPFDLGLGGSFLLRRFIPKAVGVKLGQTVFIVLDLGIA